MWKTRLAVPVSSCGRRGASGRGAWARGGVQQEQGLARPLTRNDLQQPSGRSPSPRYFFAHPPNSASAGSSAAPDSVSRYTTRSGGPS